MAALSRRTDAQNAKRAAVEQALLDATEHLLGEGATYAELSVERIAKQAGISRTAFYFYFRDKRELLMRVTEDVSQDLFATAERWWSADAERGEGALAEALHAVLAVYQQHAVSLRAVVEASTYDEPVAEFWRAVVGRFVDASRERIAAEQAAGHAPADVDPAAVAFALTWMTERACYQHVVRGGVMDDDALVRALAAIWARAVYARLG